MSTVRKERRKMRWKEIEGGCKSEAKSHKRRKMERQSLLTIFRSEEQSRNFDIYKHFELQFYWMKKTTTTTTTTTSNH
jgi:hypothetical protein